MFDYSHYLHFILELYDEIRYFIGTNTVKRLDVLVKKLLGRRIQLKQFSEEEVNSLLKKFVYKHKPKYIGEV